MNKPEAPFSCLGKERATRFLCDAQMLNIMADGLPGVVAYYDLDFVCHFVNATVESWTGAPPAAYLARRLGVTHVTVNRTLQRLQRGGLVTTQPYRSIFLTPAGQKLSVDSRRRHEIVAAFLRSLGVPDAIANADAEGMEHHASPETLRAFTRHLKRRRRRKP